MNLETLLRALNSDEGRKLVADTLHARDQAVADATVHALRDAGLLRLPGEPIPVVITEMPNRVHVALRDAAGNLTGSLETDE